MIEFWAGVALLVAIALWSIVRPLLRPKPRAQIVRSRENIAFYRNQLRDVEDEFKSGALSAEQRDQAKREIEARLLEDVDTTDDSRPLAARPARATAYALLALIPLGAFAVYLVVGAPAALDPAFVAANDPAHGRENHGNEEAQTCVQTEAPVIRLQLPVYAQCSPPPATKPVASFSIHG